MSDNTTLLRDWHRGCGGYSLTHQMVRHPLFAEIIERGPALLWDTFAIYSHNAWIGWAVVLGTITKARPTLPEGTAEAHGGLVGWDVRKLRDAWIAWGREHGYVVDHLPPPPEPR